MEELVEEILHQPACRIHAALVCKSWHRILSDVVFLRRYRDFHLKPYFLGYIHNGTDFELSLRFASTSAAFSFSPPAALKRWQALDCRHGRVLVSIDYPTLEFIVWDPNTDEQYHLPFLPSYPLVIHNVVVLCAVDGCDHVDCHGGPFFVVFVGD
ncbi:hypothetical protein PR202_ga28507 [Eleusine coracana subsp. coracana]|uniref:F-box domain-containing protein n=1 Tax=Eleusine coracana subsp. coracana TaxID=191504 RepID=A0AAV5DJT2_ELECO|nr:hypothetical protein PR202_ga28507 [Eleusine coracana subsp. coracana]